MRLGSFCSRKENKLVALQPKSLRITGMQKGFVQNLEIYQSIQADKNLDEVSYIFPSDNNLCIYGMKFQVGEETINAELRSNKAAEETFKQAKKVGFIAAKTEKVAPGITSVKIGNVPKDKVVAIIFQCAFLSTLQNPTTILTKIPLQASEPDGSVTDLYNLPSLEINVDLSISHLQPISDVYTNCESNYNKIDDYNGELTIKSALITDENILIMTKFTGPVQSQMIQANMATSISIIPEFEATKSNSNEYVFLIDCSASMLGESIRKAKESLHLFLSKLPPGSYFNIIRFGTTYEKLFEESSEKVDSTIEEAKKFIEKMKANLGGTEMLSMLDELFKKEVKIGCQRQLFVITDGEVYARQKVVQKVSENRGYNRIFAIGLGHGADAGFLEEITEITNGKSDFVFSKDELPAKVAEQLDLSLLEAASGAQLHIDGSDSFEVVPYPLPPLLPGVVTHLFVHSESPFDGAMVSARIAKNGSEIENVILLKDRMAVGEPLDLKSPVFALFAWNQLKRIANDEEKSVALSLSSGVLCDHTSYVAVYAKPANDGESDDAVPVLRKVEFDSDDEGDRSFEDCCMTSAAPVCTYHGGRRKGCGRKSTGGMTPRKSLGAKAARCSTPVCTYHGVRRKGCGRKSTGGMTPRKSLGAKAARKSTPVVDSQGAKKQHESDESDESDETSEIKTSDESDETSEIKTSDPVYGFGSVCSVKVNACSVEKIDKSKVWSEDASVIDVVRLQSKDGFWDLPSLFVAQKCNGKQPVVPGIDLSESPIVRKRAVSTVFALAFLAKFFAEARCRWRFAWEKGLRWLKRIESGVDWEKIIDGIAASITK